MRTSTARRPGIFNQKKPMSRPSKEVPQMVILVIQISNRIVISQVISFIVLLLKYDYYSGSVPNQSVSSRPCVHRRLSNCISFNCDDLFVDLGRTGQEGHVICVTSNFAVTKVEFFTQPYLQDLYHPQTSPSTIAERLSL